jgi:hypothetical protein
MTPLHQQFRDQLASWSADPGEAHTAGRETFDAVISTLLRFYPDVGRLRFELMLADARRDAEELFDGLLTDSVARTDAINVFTRFTAED